MTVSDERVAPTICTRRQEQGFVSLGALCGVFGFGSWARSALVKWGIRRQRRQQRAIEGYKMRNSSDIAKVFTRSEKVKTSCEPTTHRLSTKVKMNRQRIADMKVQGNRQQYQH